MRILSKSSDETVRYGKALGKILKGGQIVALEGDLGGGKTHFTKGIARGLGLTHEIVSPTFVVRRDYPGKINLVHYDFYRLDPEEELLEGLKEAMSSDDTVTVIEWAEKIEKILPDNIITIKFKYKGDNEREIVLEWDDKQKLARLSYEIIKCQDESQNSNLKFQNLSDRSEAKADDN